MCSNIPASPAYGVYISQLIRYARSSSNYSEFLKRHLHLRNKLLDQSYEKIRLIRSLKKFIFRYQGLVEIYSVCRKDYKRWIFINPASFAGPDELNRFVRKDGKFVLSKYKIKKWLQRQEPYSLQRPIKRPVKRNRVVVIGIDDQWDVDLMDMTKFSKYNREYNFILVAIDIFSKYIWLRQLKDKRGESVMKALKNIFVVTLNISLVHFSL
jgi:hypothetical protein